MQRELHDMIEEKKVLDMFFCDAHDSPTRYFLDSKQIDRRDREARGVAATSEAIEWSSLNQAAPTKAKRKEPSSVPAVFGGSGSGKSGGSLIEVADESESTGGS